jgi:DNA-directed RNA polymerase subunit F
MKYLLLCSLILLTADPLFAQRTQQPRRGPAMERIEQLRKLRMMEAMRLDEETSIRFFTRYNRHRERLRELQERREAHIRHLEELNRQGASAEEIEKALEELRSFDRAYAEAKNQFVEELREILTPEQRARYFIFEENFNRFLRELMRDIQRERMERRPLR